MKKIQLILLTVFILTGCRKIVCIDGNHHTVRDERDAGVFNRVEADGSYDIIITYDSVPSLVVEAESNINRLIATSRDGNTLKIQKARGHCIDIHRTVRVYIRQPHINSVDLDGSGNISCNGFNEASFALNLNGSGYITASVTAENLEAVISGSGDIYLSGIAGISKMRINGSGKIDGYNLKSKDGIASIDGSGDIMIHADSTLDASISGSGNIYYTGKPIVSSRISGSGNISSNN